MLHIKPIAEYEASSELQGLYGQIKTRFHVASTPLIFQYLANFPSFLLYVWEQSDKNLRDRHFNLHSDAISRFAYTALSEVYDLSPAMELFLKDFSSPSDRYTIGQFVTTALHMHASLYLLSISYRESLKGKYLGIKQLGDRLTDYEERAFHDVAEGFVSSPIPSSLSIQPSSSSMQFSENSRGVQTTKYQGFFKRIDWDMRELQKKEEYLFRRVELERFTLAKLPLLSRPIDTSFHRVAKEFANNPLFPELLYLLAEYFPTQAPYKLFASCMMQLTLTLLPV